MADKKRLNESYDSKYRKIVNHIKKIMPKETRWSYDDYRVVGDDLGGGIRFQIEFDSKDSSLQKRIMDSIEDYFYGVHCDTGWGRNWDYYISVNVDEKACNETFNKTNKLTLNEDLFEESNKPYKIRFYKLKGSDKGNLDHEEFFDTKKEAINRYREAFKKELFSLNPTVWELRDGDYKRLMNHELVDESIKEGWESIDGLKFTRTGVHGEKLDDDWIDYGDYLVNKNRLQDEMLRDFKEENGYTRADEDREEFWKEFDKFIAERGREYLDRAVNESLKEDLTLVPEEPSDETPATPEANGVAKLILDAINGETDTIKEYNDLIANTDNEDIIKIIQDITAEENNHIGMLQRALEIVSPNASNIDDGMEEAESMIEEPVVNAEPDFVPIGESLKEELQADDAHSLLEYNQHIQDTIGDMLSLIEYSENPDARKKMVKASFLISEAVEDAIGDRDIDESLKKNLEEDVSSDEACNELIDEAYRYLEMAADMFEDGAETYHIDGSLGPAQFIDDVGEITYNLDRISSEVFNAVHGIDESLNEKKITEPRSAHYKNCDIVKDLQDKFWEIKYRGRQTIKDGFKSFMDAKAWIDDNLISGKLNQSLVTEDVQSTVNDKQIKNAIMDVLKARVDRENYGMMSRASASMKNIMLLADNNIDIDRNMRFVTKDGEKIFKIKRKYASKKVNGMYKELTPTLEPINESITEDIHDKFKRDIKTAYKKWASDVERVEAKRKEAMEMIPDNASKEQISQYTDFVNNKIYPMVSDFDYKFPHNIEKGDFPFYVTYYSEYPIYEPAEGGYYYAGRDAVWSQGFNSEEEARQFLNDFIVEDGEDWEQDQDGRYTVHGKYIGQDQTVKLEPNQDYLSAIAGWHPYE